MKKIKVLIFLNITFFILILFSLSSSFLLIKASENFKEKKDFSISGVLLVRNHSLLPFPFQEPKIKKSKTIIAVVTAYYPSKKETDNTPCISASGLNICKTKKNIVACPRKYPFGTRVIIEGKLYFCEDRTNIKYDGIFDILVKDKKEMLKWGKKILPVTILD